MAPWRLHAPQQEAGWFRVKSCHVQVYGAVSWFERAVSRSIVPCQHVSRLIRVKVAPWWTSRLTVDPGHEVPPKYFPSLEAATKANSRGDLVEDNPPSGKRVETSFWLLELERVSTVSDVKVALVAAAFVPVSMPMTRILRAEQCGLLLRHMCGFLLCVGFWHLLWLGRSRAHNLGAARPDSLSFLAAGPVRNAPERSWHASGSIFRRNRRFWVRFEAFLMI